MRGLLRQRIEDDSSPFGVITAFSIITPRYYAGLDNFFSEGREENTCCDLCSPNPPPHVVTPKWHGPGPQDWVQEGARIWWPLLPLNLTPSQNQSNLPPSLFPPFLLFHALFHFPQSVPPPLLSALVHLERSSGVCGKALALLCNFTCFWSVLTSSGVSWLLKGH